MKKMIPVFLLLLLLAAGGTLAVVMLRKTTSPELVFYGNVDDRRVHVAFQIPERILQIIPEEGTFVRAGDLLGQLDETRIQNDLEAERAGVAVAEAAASAAEAALAKARNGSRREDIELVQSGIAGIQAKLNALRTDYQRQKNLVVSHVVSQQKTDFAEAEYLLYHALLLSAQAYLSKLQAGSRVEDIAAAEAHAKQAKAQWAHALAKQKITEQRLLDCRLYAPCDGIVANRLLEAGEMATPQNPAFSLAIISPKWIRIYVPETLLTKIKSGDPANVYFDGHPRPFEGVVGFVAPQAQFTPKNVETPELRTSLVYEYRVYVKDPDNVLKLGAPATVRFPHLPTE